MLSEACYGRESYHRASAPGQACWQGPDNTSRRVRTRRDAPHSRRQAWCAFDEAGDCNRTIKSATRGRETPSSTHKRQVDDETQCGVRRTCSTPRRKASCPPPFASEHRRAEARRSGARFASGPRASGTGGRTPSIACSASRRGAARGSDEGSTRPAHSRAKGGENAAASPASRSLNALGSRALDAAGASCHGTACKAVFKGAGSLSSQRLQQKRRLRHARSATPNIRRQRRSAATASS
jgi:hypothetical protein